MLDLNKCFIIFNVGYNRRIPRTSAGKLTAVACALVGIPILLVYLALAGSCLAAAVRRTVCCGGKGSPSSAKDSRRKNSTQTKSSCRSCDRARCDMDGHSAMTSARTAEAAPPPFPKWPCLLILLAYVCAGAGAFCALRPEWGFVDGFFFCFAVLATIGMSAGDSDESRVGAGSSSISDAYSRPSAASARDHRVLQFEGAHSGGEEVEDGDTTFVLLCTLYLLLGLAIISMCVNLVTGGAVFQAPSFCGCLDEKATEGGQREVLLRRGEEEEPS